MPLFNQEPYTESDTASSWGLGSFSASLWQNFQDFYISMTSSEWINSQDSDSRQLQAVEEDERTYRVRFHLFQGLPFPHNAVTLVDKEGKRTSYSFNTGTQEENEKLEEDRDYTPRGELSFLDEDDSATKAYQFYKRQIAPMVDSEPELATKDIPDSAAEVVDVPVSLREFDKAQRWLKEQQQGIKNGTTRYSVYYREDKETGTTHHSCASFTDEVLKQISRASEKNLLEPSTFESMATPYPTDVHERAQNLAAARQQHGFLPAPRPASPVACSPVSPNRGSGADAESHFDFSAVNSNFGF